MNFRRPRRHFDRCFSLDLAVLAPEPARPSSPGRLQASIFKSETGVLAIFFRAKSARREKRPISTKHNKNKYETHVRAYARRAKTDEKSIRRRLERHSATEVGSRRVIWRSRRADEHPRRPTWRPRRPTWRRRWLSWMPGTAILAPKTATLAAKTAILARSGSLEVDFARTDWPREVLNFDFRIRNVVF